MSDLGSAQGQEPAPESPAPVRSRAWIAPTIYLLAVVVPVVVLIFSNTDTARIGFAGWEWNAPLWLILAITFVAGAIVTRLLGWVWRTMRRRRREKDRAPG